MASLASGLTHLSGWVAYLVIAALVFGETAVFIGFVLPGEIAVVLGGVLASRGHLSLPLLIVIVVAAAIAGPFVGYEVGKRMGDRVFSARVLTRVSGHVERATTTLRRRGGIAVLAGRFVAVLRALMPAAAGAAQVRYRTFTIFNVLGGLLWGAGYCLLGYLAGSTYAAVEGRVGTGLAIVIAVLVVAALLVWGIRRHRAGAGVRQAKDSGSVADASVGGPAVAGVGLPTGSVAVAGPGVALATGSALAGVAADDDHVTILPPPPPADHLPAE